MLRLLPALAALVLVAVPASTMVPGEAPVVAPMEVPDELVIGFHGPIPADVEAWLAPMGGSLILRDDTLHWVSAKFQDATQAQRALRAAEAQGHVRFAARDATASIALEPNDPRYGEQWGYPAIFAPQAWDIEMGSHDVKVAVIDTGVRATHPDLVANLCGPHVSTVPGSPNPDDDYGHGTHVIGTVAAATNNGVGVAGTAQTCVMSARVLQFGGGQWSWIAAGVTWAANNGADIISMSLQGPFHQVMQDAVRHAYNNKGALVVSAAGNWGCSGLPTPNNVLNDGTIAYPGRYDESMAVAALVDPGLETAGFSSCGADMEIAGPGAGVLSTVPGGYASFSGTSMATPHVSGVAALVKAQNPSISNVALRCLLDLTADEIGLPGRDFQTGWGKLNALRALLTDQVLTEGGGYDAFEQACRAGAKQIMH
jgi:thermitase